MSQLILLPNVTNSKKHTIHSLLLISSQETQVFSKGQKIIFIIAFQDHMRPFKQSPDGEKS